jgi:hypothetical protein
MPPSAQRQLTREELDEIRNRTVADLSRSRGESVDLGSNPVPVDDDAPVNVDLGVHEYSLGSGEPLDDDEAPITRAPVDAFRDQGRAPGLRTLEPAPPMTRARTMPAHEAMPSEATQDFHNRASAFDAANDPLASGMPRPLQAPRASADVAPSPPPPRSAEAPSETFTPRAPEPDDEASITQRERNEAYGAPAPARAEAMPQTPRSDDDPITEPRARINKSARAPVDASQFGPNAAEQSRLAEAEHDDLRSDRWRRALSGLGSVFGALAGVIPGIGIVSRVATAGSGAVRPHNERQDAVRRDIASRLESSGGMRAYQDQQAQGAATAQRQAQQDQRQAGIDALNARETEASIGLAQARTAGETADTQTAEIERQLAAGDTVAARRGLRALANGLNDDSGMANEIRDFVNSPEFEGASGELVREYTARVVQLANNRRAGLLESGGGGGGGGRLVQDPVTGAFRRVGGGGGAPRAPGGAAASAAGPPVARSGAAPRPAPAPAAAPATAMANPRLVAINSVFPDLDPDQRAVMLRSMIQHRYEPAQLQDPRVQSVLNAAVTAYDGAPAARREALLREAEGTMARDIDDRELPASIVDPRGFAQAADLMRTINEQHIRPYGMARIAIEHALANGVSENDMRIILAGGERARQVASARGYAGLLSAVQQVRENYGRERSGAAISPSEWENFNTILGSPSVLTPHASADFIGAMRQLENLGQSSLRSAAQRGAGLNDPVEVYDEFVRRQRRLNAIGRRPR